MRPLPVVHILYENRDSVVLIRDVLVWLEAAGRRVINGSRAFEIELSKGRRYVVLRWHGIETPRTVLAVGRKRILEEAHGFHGLFLTKSDHGGNGLGIRLFESPGELAAYLDSGALERVLDNRLILHDYIRTEGPFVTREIARWVKGIAVETDRTGGR